MCSELATSKEHTPPKCFFPEDKYIGKENTQRIDLITVPSCDLHNGQKSGDDEYLLYLFTMSERANGYGKANFHTKVIKAAKRRPKLSEHIFSIESEIDGNTGYQIDRERINQTIGQISRAIFHHETGLKWFPPVHVNSTIFEVPEEQDGIKLDRKAIISPRWEFVTKTMGLLKDKKWLGSNPKTFKYKFLYENNEFLLMHFMFYDNIDFQIISHPETWNLDFGV